MLSTQALNACVSGLIKLARNSEDMKKEVKKFREHPSKRFCKLVKLEFGPFDFEVLFLGQDPVRCKEYYKLVDKRTNIILTQLVYNAI